MTDMYEQQRKEMLRQLGEYVDSIEERRERAIEALGEKYLLHPANRVQRRTVPYGSVR
jgi:hypothetical protein